LHETKYDDDDDMMMMMMMTDALLANLNHWMRREIKQEQVHKNTQKNPNYKWYYVYAASCFVWV
jgi:hypothetical protein